MMMEKYLWRGNTREDKSLNETGFTIRDEVSDPEKGREGEPLILGMLQRVKNLERGETIKKRIPKTGL